MQDMYFINRDKLIFFPHFNFFKEKNKKKVKTQIMYTWDMVYGRKL